VRKRRLRSVGDGLAFEAVFDAVRCGMRRVKIQNLKVAQSMRPALELHLSSKDIGMDGIQSLRSEFYSKEILLRFPPSIELPLIIAERLSAKTCLVHEGLPC
jgi:hypothetical protein